MAIAILRTVGKGHRTFQNWVSSILTVVLAGCLWFGAWILSMVGGGNQAVAACRPIFDSLAPGIGAAPRTRDNSWVSPAESGWLHCGAPGAGHFVKMVHNGVEYGMMQAPSFNILKNANAGSSYDIDVAEVAECWRRGSVVGSCYSILLLMYFAAIQS